MKTWITTEVFNHTDQKLLIQPTPEFDGIEVYIQEVFLTKEKSTGAFYINKEELPVIINRLQDMMEYVNSK